MGIENLSIVELVSLIKKQEISCEEIINYFLDRIVKLDDKLNSFVSIHHISTENAKEIDKKISQGEDVGPLAGVPIAIKDLICTKGIKTTAGSKILNNFIPPYDATLVEKLKNAGAIVIGKNNLDEFAMGSSNETSYFGICHNPWDLDYVPGGSSGGSAACVAARLSPASVGTDTGGSIRLPASYCNLVGLKPTYGRISRYGIIAYASSLDQAGPITRSVKDSALLLEVMAGKDKKEMTSSSVVVEKWLENINTDLSSYTIGLPTEYFSDNLTSEVNKTINLVIEVLKNKKAKIIEVSLPLTPYMVPIYYLIATSEASSNLSRYDGIKYGYRTDLSKLKNLDLDEFYSKTRAEGFGKEVRRRIMLGTYALSSGYYDAYYKKASQVRKLMQNQFFEAFKKCDAFLTPVSTAPAFKIGERIKDPLAMYYNDVFTTSANLVGIPAISVPAGFSLEGLPIGVQFMANHFQEQKLFNIAQVIENELKVKEKKPDVI